MLLAAIVLAGIACGGENASAPTVPVVQQPFDSAQGKPVAQPVQPAPMVVPAKEWPKVEVMWSEPFLIKSLAELPPVEKGFYRGTANGEDGSGASGNNDPNNPVNVYVTRILPQLEKMIIVAGVARDPVDKNIVFAGIQASLPTPLDAPIGSRGEGYGHLLLSLDGEKSWYQISSFYDDAGQTPLSVRVVRNGDALTQFAADHKFVAPMWRKATLSLKNLP
jgi:hypothetical protein